MAFQISIIYMQQQVDGMLLKMCEVIIKKYWFISLILYVFVSGIESVRL